jgi:uncharacterized phage protein (TIGR02218 family)
MQAHLSSGTTTLCWCYRVTRANGIVMGFTDHDRDLTVDGVLYEALSGISGSEFEENIGLGVDNQDIQGAIRSDRLTEDDIISGEYDNAEVVIYRVNWDNVADKVLIKVGTIGEITRSDSYFKAEFRGLSHYLQQPQGRIYQYQCDVGLGSSRCGVNLASYTSSGIITSIADERVFYCSGALTGYASDYFARGKLSWLTGLNTGRSIEIKAHGLYSGVAIIEIWHAATKQVAAGDTFTISAGCDKLPKTCRDRYANFINFQGFPYMPGQDFIGTYVNKDDTNQNGGTRGSIFD